MAQATKKAQSSQSPAHRQQGPAEVRLHPAAAAGFAEGDLATLESEVASMVS